MENNITRRRFLKLFGIGGASIALAANIFTSSAIFKKGRADKRAFKRNGSDSKIAELKHLLDEMRKDIKRNKQALNVKNGSPKQFGYLDSRLHAKRLDYRYHHIAYSEILGNKRSRIERPRKGNSPGEHIINQIKKRYA